MKDMVLLAFMVPLVAFLGRLPMCGCKECSVLLWLSILTELNIHLEIRGHRLTGLDTNITFLNVWYPDSGATNQFTPDASNLMDSVSLSGTDQVHIGNGQGLPITSIGAMHFTSPFEPQTTLKLKNLLLVPSITKNLVSVSQFARDNNVFFEFHDFILMCFVKSQVSSKILLQGSLGKDGLYQFEQAPLSKPTNTDLSVNVLCNKAVRASPSLESSSSLHRKFFM
jgi:hypothetical protein